MKTMVDEDDGGYDANGVGCDYESFAEIDGNNNEDCNEATAEAVILGNVDRMRQRLEDETRVWKHSNN